MFRSRATAQTHSSLPSDAVSGEWQTLHPLQINGASVQSGDVLMADLEGRLEVQDGSLREIRDWRAQGLKLVVVQHLLGFAEQSLNLVGRTFSDWQQGVPLHVSLHHERTLTPLDQEIANSLFHLEYVSREPTSQLDYLEERLSVERSRRLSSRALPYLAAHTEDWLHPTFQGVRPRNVLSMVRDENLNLYENRVSVKLVDHLFRYLSDRIDSIQFMTSALMEAAELQHQAAQGTHRRNQRLYHLWGEALSVSAETEITRLDGLERHLSSLRGRVARCRHQHLYSRVPRTFIPRALRPTNIFLNDKHYRFIARLWRAWDDNTQATGLPEVNHSLLQRVAATWDAFALMLTARALSRLNYTQVLETPLRPGAVLELEHRLGDKLTLYWNRDGTHELLRAEQLLLKIIPLPTYVSTDALERLKAPKSMIVHLTSEGAKARATLEISSPLGLHVQVSPSHLNSAEVYGRSITTAVIGTLFMLYPPKSPRLTETTPPFAEREGEDWVLLRIPTPEEEAALELERERNRLYANIDRSEKSRAPGEKTTLVRLRNELEAFNQKNETFRQAVVFLRHLITCPLCSTASEHIELRVDRQLEVRCVCGAQWGLRRCPTGHRYPYLLPEKKKLSGPEEAEELFGMDLLALPRDGGGKRYICPDCGH